MRIAEIMNTSVEPVEPTLSAAAARQRMTQARVHHLVVARGRRVVGIVSARDLAERPNPPTGNPAVGDLMTADPTTASPETTVKEAANLLRGNAIGCLPVVEEGKLVGVVTVADLLELLGRGPEPEMPHPHGQRKFNRIVERRGRRV